MRHVLVGLVWLVRTAHAAPSVGGCPVFPEDHIWNVPVNRLPVHPLSSQWVASIGAAKPLHPDFGAGLYRGAQRGIPFALISGDPPHAVPVRFRSPESDPGPYAIPPDPPIEGEGRLGGGGDRHLLVVDLARCRLYELFDASGTAGNWRAGSGAIFDLRSYSLRPAGWTSADAAGLPIFPGLVRHSEVASGSISHALRFTVPRTSRTYLWPARHYASRLDDPALPPMGARFRLRSSFPTHGFPPQAKIILEALKIYGMMVADNGGPWFLSGSPDENWVEPQLDALRRVRGADFEAVDTASLIVHADSGRSAPTPKIPNQGTGSVRNPGDSPN